MARTGGNVAQRNTLRRAQADTRSRYAESGTYHSAATTPVKSTITSTFNQATVSHIATAGGRCPSEARTIHTSENRRAVGIDRRYTPSGTTACATSSLERTVAPSEAGSDFQKRMLRSLRSA